MENIMAVDGESPTVIDRPDANTATIEKTKNKNKLAKRWCIIIFNDDVTPFEFVIYLLIAIFKHDEQKCTQIAFDAHTKGREICYTGSKEVCELRLEQGNELINAYNQVLKLQMEPIE